MKRIVDVYVETVIDSGNYSKIELFNDEKIDISLSVQNVQDISKVYTHFTQSFTIPASPINNAIFEHFNQSDVDSVNNPNKRRASYIEIGLTPFRAGKLQLEKSNIKNGQVDSYTVTFYGDLVSLKDKFGNDKLADLDLNAYTTDYTGSNIESLIISTDYTKNVRFPLITSSVLWSSNDGLSTDIKTSAGAINYNELFPAIKVGRIIDSIESKYGVTFNGTFFDPNNKAFDRLFLWLKNGQAVTNFNNKCIFNSVLVNNVEETPSLTYGLDPVTNEIFIDTINEKRNNKVEIYFETSVPCVVKVECYENLSFKYYRSADSGSGWLTLYQNPASNPSTKLSYRINTSVPCTITNIKISVKRFEVFTGITTFIAISDQTISCDDIVISQKPSLQNLAPDITVADFFSGILKMFNLTCYATAVDTFLVETLDTWYSKGYIYDITEFTDTDSIDIERVPLYKNISFSHAKSESFVNREFLEVNSKGLREYGDTKESFPDYENGDFSVAVPFEELVPLKLSGSNVCVSYCLTPGPDFKSYVPKPVLLYMDDIASCDFYFSNGSTVVNKTTYAPFCNEVTINGSKYSLSFSEEASVVDNTTLFNSLYKLYYSSYLSNLFNPKCRLVNIKAHFPLSLITKLKLNDRLVIRDKRYIINEIKSDITSGQVDLSLLNDFRPMVNNAIIDVTIDPDGGVIDTPWVVPEWASNTNFSSSYSGVTFSPATITEDSWVEITIPANPTPTTPIVSESGVDSIITEEGFILINEEYTSQEIPITVDYVESSTGASISNTITIYQS
jgi:hypothetical protein